MRPRLVLFEALLALTLANPARTLAAQPCDTTLLLDEHTVARTSNLKLQFFPAKKHPSNPVLKRTQKWEGVGPYLWGSRLMQDEQSGELRMWYIAYDFDGNFYRWGYATSRNGIDWTKPDLGVERLGEALAGNCLPLGPHPEKGTRSIARDPRPETPSQRRYLGVRFTYEGEFVSFSPDGIAWLEYPLNPVWFVPSDIIHVLWDEHRNHFAAYFKVWELSGTEITPSGAERPFTAWMPTFTDTKLAEGRTAFEGPVIHFRPNAAAQVSKGKFVLRAGNQSKDDGGGTSLSGAWCAKRVQAWAESDDGIHWRNEQIVLRADAKDPPTANIQYLFVIPHGGYYLGFLTMHDESGVFRIQLAYSTDGLRWNRPWREPWLDVGPEGAFDRGMVLGPADPIFWEREMWFAYGGFPIHHDSPSQNWESAIGLATMRLDGFAAWRSGPAQAEPGELVTQPFTCSADHLFINSDAGRGSVTVEVLGADGKPVEGLEASACHAIRSDTLTHPGDGWVQWGADRNFKAVLGKTIQLRFILKDADLFSFRLADEKAMAPRVPRATNR